MGWFDSFRDDGLNTYYSSNRIAVWADVTQVIVAIICTVVVAALVIVVLGTRGKERLTTFIRALFTLHAGIVILLTLFSQQWLVTDGRTRCPYMVDRHHDISAYVTISVGLSSVNVTLQGDTNETQPIGEINYNEEFSFVGVYDMKDSLQNAKSHGLPDTILYIVEYFSVDSGDLRWCRYLRSGGRFAGILLWASFAMWIVYNIVLCFVVLYGAIMMSLAGLSMMAACALYHFLQPPTPLTIPFDDAYVKFGYGWCLYAALFSGIITFLTGLILMLLCRYTPKGVSKVFMIDLSELECNQEDLTDDGNQDTTMYLDFRRRSSQAFDNKGFVASPKRPSQDQKSPSHLSVDKINSFSPLNGASNNPSHRSSIFEFPTVSRQSSDGADVLPAITVVHADGDRSDEISQAAVRKKRPAIPEEVSDHDGADCRIDIHTVSH